MNQSIKNFYYSKTFVLMEIVKLARNKELAFLPNLSIENNKAFEIRHINSSFIDLLKKNFEAFHFFDKDKNYLVYLGLASLKGNWSSGLYNDLNVFSFAPAIRKKQQEIFAEKFESLVCGFDMAVDIDGDKHYGKDLIRYSGELAKIMKKDYKRGILDIEFFNGKQKRVKVDKVEDLTVEESVSRALPDLKKIKKEFDSYKVCYSVTFSGGRGLHPRIRDESLPNVSPQKKMEITNQLKSELADILDLPCVDPAANPLKKIWKMPYSLVNDLVALPLTDEQIENFKLNEMKALNVLNKIKIKDRGLCERNADLSIEDKKGNFMQLLKDYDVTTN